MNGDVQLHYRLAGPAVAPLDFTERIYIPELAKLQDPVATEVVQRLTRLLFLVAALSYYKAAVPETVRIDIAVSEAEARFFELVLRHGLTEFAYVNKLPQALSPRIQFAAMAPAAPLQIRGDVTNSSPSSSSSPVVPVGGGKDSIVTIEALRSAGHRPCLFSVNTYRPIQDTVDRSGLDYVAVRRVISPALLEANAQGAYNGHVPVTAINSVLALMVAAATNATAVVMSNERSASVENTVWNGVHVNHQWSKGIEFESLLRETLAAGVATDLEYFSLLRPISELRIARQFAKLDNYHDVFTSCNSAFRIDAARRGAWCGDCPKCRFVFLILAPFLPPARLLAIFGQKNLLADPAQQQGFLELLGLDAHKPLECVGEIEESRLALTLVAENGAWEHGPGLRALLARLAQTDALTPAQYERVFETSPEHFIPSVFRGALHAIG